LPLHLSSRPGTKVFWFFSSEKNRLRVGLVGRPRALGKQRFLKKARKNFLSSSSKSPDAD
jgi:hypothetical protein